MSTSGNLVGNVFDSSVQADSSGSVIITGDLTVEGTTTTVESTSVLIEDKVIELAHGTSGTPSGDAGIIVERGSSTNSAFIWDESADEWVIATTSATGASSGDLTLTDANLRLADVTVSGGDITYGNGQNATASIAATAHDAAGKNLTVSAGTTTAGTTNNIAGGSLTLQGGQGKGSGAGGDIIFQTANAGGSGSSLNSHATALTISDDKSATFEDNITVKGDIVLDDGGSLKEAGGTAAFTFDGSGNVTKIGQDSMSSGDVLTWDGAKFVGEAPTTGDITGVTAGDGLSGGGNTGGVTLALDLNELSAAAVAVANDSIAIIDADDDGSKKESIADLVTAIAGTAASTGLSASSGVLNVSDLHPVGVSGAANQLLTDDGDGTVTSEAKLLCDGATTTIGDGTAEDSYLKFDGNAVDFRIGIDDGTDTLEIGKGGAHGTTPAIKVDSNVNIQILHNSAVADGEFSGDLTIYQAGEDLTAGEVVYFKSDGKVWKAVATAAATSRAVAMCTASVSADAMGVFLLKGFARFNSEFPTWTIGGVLYTPEAETSSKNVPEQAAPDTDGDFVQILGYAISGDAVYFCPDSTVVEVA
jgi:hypothetical protein